ncbi:MAG: hypothetical protein ABSF62_04095 [Bryobacteraceae bacterium]
MQKYLRTWSKMAAVAVLGAAVMLVNGHYAVAAPQDPTAKQDAPAKKQKQVKDNGEYDIYNDVIKDANPTAPNYKKLLTDLDTWTQKYPNTDYKDERNAYYVQGYAGAGQPGKALDAVKGLIDGDVPGVKAKLTSGPLILPTLVLAVVSAQQIASTGSPTPDQLAIGDKVSHVLLDYAKEWFVAANKSPGLTDDQWAQGLKQMQDTANGALLQIALYPGLSILKPNPKDGPTCAKAEPAFIKALQDRPDSGQIALQVANTFFCQRAGSPDKLQQAVFEYARAVVEPQGPPFGLDAANQKTFDDFLTRTYTSLHGSKDGLVELKEMAKNSPLPPAGFKIKTAGEIALEEQAKFQKDNPQLAMWMGIEGQLSGDGGPAYFEGTLKDADVHGDGAKALKGKVVGMLLKPPDKPAKPTACNPNELLVAINLPNQTGDVAKVKLHLENWALKGKVENGTDVQWDGVPSAFTKEPFLLTMDVADKTKLDVATTACPPPPAKKSAAPAAKKKGGE